MRFGDSVRINRRGGERRLGHARLTLQGERFGRELISLEVPPALRGFRGVRLSANRLCTLVLDALGFRA